MIAIGCDHGGYELKGEILKFLEEKGYEYKDFGCYDIKSCDYPDYAKPVAMGVADGTYESGILICTTGIGMSITANKVKGVRAALCNDILTATLTRQHNNANILVLGAGIIGPMLAKTITETFITTQFSNEERHQRRIDKMEMQ